MSVPSWLQDEPEIRALLAAALDRFDQHSGEQRSRATFLLAQRYLPSLSRADEQADQTWALIEALAAAEVLEIRKGRRGRSIPIGTMPSSPLRLASNHCCATGCSGRAPSLPWRSGVARWRNTRTCFLRVMNCC